MNTRNLTLISLRNDPINRRMHGFSFRVSEDENWSSRCEFFFFFQSKFDFKSSLGAEMYQELQGNKRLAKWWSKQGEFGKNPRARSSAAKNWI